MLEIPLVLNNRLTAIQKNLDPTGSTLEEAAQQLLIVSDYALRQIDTLRTLLSDDNCSQLWQFTDYQKQLGTVEHQPIAIFAQRLRRFRHYHFLRLLLREISGLANTEETMASWSAFADAVILRALSFCEQELSIRYGWPFEESGNPARSYVLAMGKLGGRELNYSSDVDLIIAFSASGFTNGQESISNVQYYTKVVQMFIQLLQNITAEGFVFRVDLRLRPNGESGALVSSLAAMETYYQEQGRDWERYAMVKARLINEETRSPDHWFNRLIIPFVYRRYVDFSVIESLRSMKAMIEREVQLNPRLDDIKRGMGGIREVEFIIQNIQLIRGGRLLNLRHQNALQALNAISQEKLLPRGAALKKAYLFLRKLENALQSENDQQTHELPINEVKQAQIALAMGCETWQKMVKQLHQFQRIISTIFHSILKKVDYYEDSQRLLANQLNSLWQGHVETTMAINLLTSLGYHQAEHCYQMIHSFKHSPRCRRLSQAARIRLDRFMVLLLGELVQVDETDSVLLQVIRLLENIVGRSAYLALLTENPQALKELLHWFAQSPFITSLIVNYPFLLELLLNEKQNWKPFSLKQLEQQLTNQLMYCQENELKEEALRQFKLTNWLLAARAELYGFVDSLRIGRFLADVAEVIVKQVVYLACEQLQNKQANIAAVGSQFAILAYGKLGSREMNYDSDLDLVFLHFTKSKEESRVIRLTQKIMHMLTTRLQFGVLYQVDTRLRPSGEAGLLVSTLKAFTDYQKTQAWTWEHQALIRSRVLVGSRKVYRVVKELKQEVFLRSRNKETVCQDVQTMLEKILIHLNNDTVKYAPGGLLALEFLIQLLVLINPAKAYSRYTSMLGLLRLLFLDKVINIEQFQQLSRAYKHYHQLLHQTVLQPSKPKVYQEEQADVRTISTYFGLNSPYKS